MVKNHLPKVSFSMAAMILIFESVSSNQYKQLNNSTIILIGGFNVCLPASWRQ
jgi:hypothetical protein